MKHIVRKITSAALAAALLTGCLSVHASDALGHDLAAKDTELNTGTILADGTFWSDTHSDLRQENYVVYTPNGRVTPLVTYGETSRSLTTVLAAARDLEARGLRVVAGINGDYYGTQLGIPLGSTMTDGALRNANGDPYYAVGFHADGTAVIGDPKLSMQTTVNGGSGFPVFAMNHMRQSEYGIFLYDYNFNARHTTGTSEPGTDVICSVESGALTIGGALSLRVDEVLSEVTDTPVSEGKYILTANLLAGDNAATLLELQPGDQITVSVSSGAENAEAWNSVTNLLGAPVLLVEHGAVVNGLQAGSAPRTAIGQRADGTLIFYTIDGRQAGYSIGATLTAVAMRLVELGCETAVALDGGGSTTMAATMPDETAARVVNTPSDGSVRAVSNHVFLVAPNTSSGSLDHIWLSASAARALPGAQITLTAAAVDTNFIPMDASVSLTTDKGSLSGDILTLPNTAGTVKVTARYGGKSATTEIIAEEPERIVVKRGGSAVTELTIAPDSEVFLTAQGISNHLALAGGNSCFTWSYEGSGAKALPDGTLRAGSGVGAGTLTVSCGEKSLSIPVTVAALPIKLLNDFESAFAPITDVPADTPDVQPRLTLSQSTDAAHVHNGRASAKLAYSLDAETSVTLPLSCAFSSEYDRLELWAFGDGSGVALSIDTNLGGTTPITLNEGWNALSIRLPSGLRSINGFTLTAATTVAGMIWLDQLVLNYGKSDDDAPEVSLAPGSESSTLAGRAFDAVNGTTLPTLRLTYDGAALDYSYDTRTGALTAALPEPDGALHRVTLTAGDAVGNLARTTVALSAAGDASPAFPDTAGHWSDGYVAWLKRAGISDGNNGKYLPDTNITRQEFALMLYRYLAPVEDYSGVELPFADAAQIAPWALDAAKAMYALGIVNGAPGSNGTIRYNPTANVSRQEAATMIGRLLDKGWIVPEPTLTDFAAVPDWAAEHVRVLNGLGVLGGYEDGSFRPTGPLTRAQIAAMLFRLN